MTHMPIHLKDTTRQAFTLLELMVAMIILTIAMSIAFQAFSGTVRGWKRGTEVIDGIKHGDFAMSQLAAALNSTVYFNNPQKHYAFTVEKGSSIGLPADTISFVTASSAFMPADSPYIHGPHRVTLFIDDDAGNPALFAFPMPTTANAEDFEEEFGAEPVLVSRAVQGLEILFYDKEEEDWTEEWEKENSVPERIMVSVFVVSEDKAEEPIVFTRVIEIPVATSVSAKLQGPSYSPSAKQGGNSVKPNKGKGSGDNNKGAVNGGLPRATGGLQ
jgi:prepilin-type N-terminal cleavage/methylation domain-containing protein